MKITLHLVFICSLFLYEHSNAEVLSNKPKELLQKLKSFEHLNKNEQTPTQLYFYENEITVDNKKE